MGAPVPFARARLRRPRIRELHRASLLVSGLLFGTACMEPIASPLWTEGAQTLLIGAYDAIGGIDLPLINVLGEGGNLNLGLRLEGQEIFAATYALDPPQLGLEPGPIELRRMPCGPGTRALPKPTAFLTIDARSGEVLERANDLPFELATACFPAPTVPTCFDRREHAEPCYWRPDSEEEPVWCTYACPEPTTPAAPAPPSMPERPRAPDFGCASIEECVPQVPICPALPGHFLGALRCRLQATTCADHFPINLPAGPAIFVDPSEAPGGDGTRDAPYRLIDEAIGLAPGAVIALSEGTHFKDGILPLPTGTKVIGACMGGARISTTSTSGYLWIDGDDVEMSDLSFDTGLILYRGTLDLREVRIDAGGREVALWIDRGEARIQDIGLYDARVALRSSLGTHVDAARVVIGGAGMQEMQAAQVFGGSLTIDGLLSEAQLSAGLTVDSGNMEASHVLFPDVLRGALGLTFAGNATVSDSELHSRFGDAVGIFESRLALNRVRIAVDTAPGISFRATRSVVRGQDWSLIGQQQQILADQSDLRLARLGRSGPGTAISLHGPGIAHLSDLRIHGTETCPIGVEGIFAQGQDLSLERVHISNSTGVHLERGPLSSTSTLTAADVTLEGDPSCIAQSGMDAGRQSGIISSGGVEGRLSRAIVTGFDLDGIKLADDGSDFMIIDFVVRGMRTARREGGHAMSIGGRGSSFVLQRGVLEGAYTSALILRHDGPTLVTDLVVDAGLEDAGARGVLVEEGRRLAMSAFRVKGGDVGVVVSGDAENRVGRIALEDGEIRQARTAIQSLLVRIDPASLERVVLRNNACDILSVDGMSRGCGER